MPELYTAADSLVPLFNYGNFQRALEYTGDIPGVYIDAGGLSVVEGIAARNGPGIGWLKCHGANLGVSWKAPGSDVWGVPVVAPDEGPFLLEDGEDVNKWIHLRMPGEFQAGSIARVFLADRFTIAGNGVGFDDVTNSERVAGDSSTWDIILYNRTISPGTTFYDLRVWLDPSAVYLEISDDGATWVSPVTEADALAFPDLPADSTDMLYVRRTIPAGAGARASVLNRIHIAFLRV